MTNILLRSFSLPLRTSGMTFDHNGNYVISNHDNKVNYYTPEGEFLHSLGGFDINERRFLKPTGLICDHIGNIYICDKMDLKIKIFSPDGNFIHALKCHRIGWHFSGPNTISFDNDSNIIVGDTLNNLIYFFKSGGVFDKCLKFKFSLNDIKVDPNGNHVICGINKILVVKPNGERIRSFNCKNSTSITFDHDGNYVFCDSEHKIKVLSPDGKLISSVKREHFSEFSKDLVMCDNDGNYVYYDYYNNIFEVYKGPGEIPSLASLCKKQIQKNNKTNISVGLIIMLLIVIIFFINIFL